MIATPFRDFTESADDWGEAISNIEYEDGIGGMCWNHADRIMFWSAWVIFAIPMSFAAVACIVGCINLCKKLAKWFKS